MDLVYDHKQYMSMDINKIFRNKRKIWCQEIKKATTGVALRECKFD